MEKIIVAKARQLGNDADMTICLTRYGNVMGSRGSVIPLFYNLIAQEKPLTITDPHMTRYMMTLADAVDLVKFAFKHGRQGDLFVQKAPAAEIGVLANAIKKYKNSDVKTVNIGTRHGEKAHEVLVTREEMSKAEDMEHFFRIPMDNRDMNYGKFYPEGGGEIVEYQAYSSDVTRRIDEDEVIELLKKMGEVEG